MFAEKDFQKETDVSRETLEKFRVYGRLLKQWQEKINLVGDSTMGDIWRRHFWDSAQLLYFIERTSWKNRDRAWLDFGTGAGFPGMVLALLGENPVYLVEKNAKKCAFLRHVSRETGTDVEIIQKKLEIVNFFSVDIITSRALAPAGQIIEWGAPFLKDQGEYWLLKGRDVDQELTELEKNRNMRIEKFPSRTQSGGYVVRIRPTENKTG